MRRLFFIFATIYFITSCSQLNDNKDITILPNIYIQYQTGVDNRENFAISIYSKDGNMFAEKVEPNLYYGESTDSVWICKMDKTSIELIENFLNKAEELNGECLGQSTTNDEYRIIIENDTTYHINGNCDWNKLDYPTIEAQLFIKDCK